MINTAAPPSDDLDERRRQIELDTLSTWASDDNDISLWPTDWNRPLTDPSGAFNPYAIPVALRPHYKRSRELDQQIVAEWPLDRVALIPDPLRPLGLPITIARADTRVRPDGDRMHVYSDSKETHLLHVLALQAAAARKTTSAHDAREQHLDVTERACDSCGVTADYSVKRVSIAAWRHKPSRPGPKLCADCAHLINMTAADEYARRARQLGEQQVPNGRRDIVCADFFHEHEMRFLP